MSSGTAALGLEQSSLSNYADVIVTHHDVTFTVDFDLRVVHGTITYTVKTRRSGVAELVLDTNHLTILQCSLEGAIARKCHCESIIRAATKAAGLTRTSSTGA